MPPAGGRPATRPAPSSPSRPGLLDAAVSVPTAGRYGFWLAGSFRRTLALAVDGHALATARNHLTRPGVDTPLGEIDLAAGPHGIRLRYSAASLSPGSGGQASPVGPLILSTSTAEDPVAYVAPSDASSLCNQNLDWIEAVAG